MLTVLIAVMLFPAGNGKPLANTSPPNHICSAVLMMVLASPVLPDVFNQISVWLLKSKSGRFLATFSQSCVMPN